MREVLPRRQLVRYRLIGVLLVLAIYAGLTAAIYGQLVRPSGEAGDARVAIVQATQAPTRNIAVHDGWFWVDGQRFLVVSVGWDPVRPGELPWERTFRPAEIELDLQRIQAAGFNTIRTWAPLSPEELAIAERQQLRVLQGIWVDPAGDFADPVFRRRTLAEVTRAVERSRFSRAILGYVVLNEPRAKAVVRAGLDETRAFLREVVATVRALDPSAPIGYASWPGMEALDDALLDFVAFNLYPHRPRVVMDELGLAGYIALLAKHVARGRPLLVSEFGISVSPKGEVQGRGGASEQEQATQLVALSRQFFAGGATGTSVFQWSDGWWKNHERQGDEHVHDHDDPEEWFGLVAFRDVADRAGTPRPALAALAAAHQAVLVSPRDGFTSDETVPVLLVAREPIELEVSVNGGPRYKVELWSAGRELFEGKLFMPPGEGREELTFFVLARDGRELARERRLLRRGSASRAVSLSPRRQRVGPDQTIVLDVQATGDGAAGLRVSVATFAEDRYHEERQQLVLDSDGRGRIELRAPGEATLLGAIAFEDDPAVPPAERASAWAVIEVAP
jgi:hypothetical protein